MTFGTRHLELTIRKARVGHDDNGPLAHLVAHRLREPLHAYVYELIHSYKGNEYVACRGIHVDIGNAHALGDFRQEAAVSRLGMHSVIKSLRTQILRENGAADDRIYALPGLEPGMEDTLHRFRGWEAVPVEVIATLEPIWHQLSAASAPQCRNAESGVYRATPDLLERLKGHAQGVLQTLQLPFRISDHFVRQVPVDLSRLSANQRVVIEAIAFG